MQQLFYDDQPIEDHIARSTSAIFLAGPTSRLTQRTPWRAKACELLAARGYTGAAVLPEFRDRRFADAAPELFGKDPSPVAAMRAVSYEILAWETAGIERATIALFWMPFHIAAEDDPKSLPGFTTRAEVSRELVRDPHRIVLGMPRGAFSSSHIRYHAHHAGVPIHETLAATVDAALAAIAHL